MLQGAGRQKNERPLLQFPAQSGFAGGREKRAMVQKTDHSLREFAHQHVALQRYPRVAVSRLAISKCTDRDLVWNVDRPLWRKSINSGSGCLSLTAERQRRRRALQEALAMAQCRFRPYPAISVNRCGLTALVSAGSA